MAVEVARFGRKRFENVGAVDGPEVEGSVRPRSLVLSMQPVDSCSSDDRACDHCQSQYDRSIHGVFLLSLELFVNLISPHATKVAYGRSAVPRQSHLSRPECPEFADRRPGRACLTRGNFGGSHTPGNRICQLERNEAKIAAAIAFAHKAATARA
jgi:hypothetical protein